MKTTSRMVPPIWLDDSANVGEMALWRSVFGAKQGAAEASSSAGLYSHFLKLGWGRFSCVCEPEGDPLLSAACAFDILSVKQVLYEQSQGEGGVTYGQTAP